MPDPQGAATEPSAERFTFFAHLDSVFSRWHEGLPFERDGLLFRTAEHFMMHRKAQLFGAPAELRERILAAGHPRVARSLGRQVPRFNTAIWHAAARTLVAEGNYAKFTQQPAALRALIASEGTMLVEAAPWDAIWGIGLAAEGPRAQRRETWLGTNWLGEVLTDVRDTLVRAIRAAPAGA
jgi:ribA/ribD-fused uncharacterized protein